MHRYIMILLVALPCFSCRQIYNPDVDASQTALVVQGAMTDGTNPCMVKLFMAIPYDSSGTNPPVLHARVNVFDDCGNTFDFTEASNGIYTYNLLFVGVPGRNYTLHIETQDGSVYESSPQPLLPNDFNLTFSAIDDIQVKLIKDSYGQGMKVSTRGIDLLTNIKNNTDTPARFRFQVDVTTEYYEDLHMAYCWITSTPNDLVNMTDNKYLTSSNDIQNHTLVFLPTEYYIKYWYYNDRGVLVEGAKPIINRVVKVTSYRMNNEAYQFYKNMNTLLSASGKMFDPAPYQLKGNITCKTDPKKLVLGFFEASSAKIDICSIKPGSTRVFTVDRFDPSSPGGCSLTPPDFWVY